MPYWQYLHTQMANSCSIALHNMCVVLCRPSMTSSKRLPTAPATQGSWQQAWQGYWQYRL